MRTKNEIMQEITEYIETSKEGKAADVTIQEQIMIELLLDIREQLTR